MNESAADRQAAKQTEQQEKKYGDSSAAVSNDTQFADPRQASDGASFKSDDATVNEATQGDGGEASRGESTVFGEPDQPSDSSYEGTEGDDDAPGEPTDPSAAGQSENKLKGGPDTAYGQSVE